MIHKQTWEIKKTGHPAEHRHDVKGLCVWVKDIHPISQVHGRSLFCVLVRHPKIIKKDLKDDVFVGHRDFSGLSSPSPAYPQRGQTSMCHIGLKVNKSLKTLFL
jgi:hypothetical protein